MKKLLTISLISLCGLTIANNVENFSMYTDKLITIKAGSRSTQENESHRKICESKDAVDVTDITDIQVGYGVSDVVMCMSPHQINHVPTAGSLSNPIPNASLVTYAPSGRVGTGAYWITGTVAYYNATLYHTVGMSVGVNADHCGATGYAPTNVVNGTGSIQVSCSYPSGKTLAKVI